MVMAGMMTYYYHMNEPADDNGDEPSSQVTRLDTRSPIPSVFPLNS